MRLVLVIAGLVGLLACSSFEQLVAFRDQLQREFSLTQAAVRLDGKGGLTIVASSVDTARFAASRQSMQARDIAEFAAHEFGGFEKVHSVTVVLVLAPAGGPGASTSPPYNFTAAALGNTSTKAP
jgi:hypothetical protein